MDLLGRHEIYIPKDAEVKSIPLQSLPRSVLTRMGLSPADSDASRKLTDSPEGIWICPAVLRPKGQKPAPAPNTGNSLLEHMSSVIAKESRASPGPIQMSVISSNRAAHKVLRDTIRGANVSEDTSSSSSLPPGSAPQTYQLAVVIYQGRIYLSIRKPSRSRRQGETRDAQTASGPAAPSTSDTSSNNQRKRTAPQAAPKAASKQPQKKRLRIPLPPGSLKLMKNLTKKTPAGDQVSEELLDGSRPERNQSQSKETQGGNKTSSQTSSFVPQPANRAHRVDDQTRSQTPEEAASTRSPGQSTAAGGGGGGGGGGGAANTSQSTIMHTNSHMDSRDQSWTRRESQSSSLQQQQQQQCDFKELEQDERIAQIRARLRQQEAALKNLTK